MRQQCSTSLKSDRQRDNGLRHLGAGLYRAVEHGLAESHRVLEEPSDALHGCIGSRRDPNLV